MNNITKTAMITICGRPNVGKSSLTNALVGEKIAIVSDKPQTTRNRIYGVVNREDTQFVLLDSISSSSTFFQRRLPPDIFVTFFTQPLFLLSYL